MFADSILPPLSWRWLRSSGVSESVSEAGRGNLTGIYPILRSIPYSNMAGRTSRNDAVLFKPDPAHRVIINDLRLVNPVSWSVSPMVRLTLTITGGNSAVRVLDSTACSIRSSLSTVFDVRLELERNLVLTWLSARCRSIGKREETLSRCRSDDFSVLELFRCESSFHVSVAYRLWSMQHPHIEVPKQ